LLDFSAQGVCGDRLSNDGWPLPSAINRDNWNESGTNRARIAVGRGFRLRSPLHVVDFVAGIAEC